MAVERGEVRSGVELSWERVGAGGEPLLLVHGWPETRRIWARNIGALAAAGYEVIAPDLRGFGDSGLAPDGFYDLAAHSRDLEALVRGVLGHSACVACAGDLGGAVVYDLGLRFGGFVTRQCLFNCPLPSPRGLPDRTRMAADYFARQGKDADALAAELPDPAARTRYVREFYGHRFWAAPGAFSREDAAWHAEPFADAERLRAGWGNYESALGRRELSAPPCFALGNPVPTLVLYGPEDHVIPPDFPARAAAAFSSCVGPFVVEGAGHFLQWERADVLNGALAWFGRGG